jgi:hypothetical protein
MSNYAFRRPPAVNLEGTMSPARPRENPLEEFASLMGVDVSALKRFDGAGDFVPTSGASRELEAAETKGSPKAREDEKLVHGSNLLSAARQAPDLYRSAQAPPTPRRSRALTLGVFVALGVAGCLGAWALKGASGSPSISAIEADDPPTAQPAEQKTAALHDDTTSVSPEDQTGKPGPGNPVSTDKQPSALEEQIKSPTTTPSTAPSPIPAEAAPSAAAPVSASAAPPVTRSIAPPASASEPTQVPAPIVASPTASTATPEPNRLKTASVRTDGSASPPSAPRTSTAPSDMVPALLNPPTPVARPSGGASAGGATKPVKERLDAPAEPSANAVRDEPVARIDAAAAPNAPPAANGATDPGRGGVSAVSVLQFVPNLYEKAASALHGSPPATPVAAMGPAAPPTASVAAGSSEGSFSAQSVLQFVPNLYEKAAGALRGSPPATQIARADPKPPTAGDEGDYGVQFAAPATEPAARRESARLRSKFANELGGLQPTVRQAEVHGRKIYQVRIGGMSKADAAALCLKLKSSGGEAACSVARD